MTQTPTPTQIEFAGRTIDLAKVLPLRLRDYRALERRGVNADKAIADTTDGKLEGLFQLTLFILQQADGGATTEDELGELFPDQLRELWERMSEIGKALREADRPFARSSISADVISTGVPAT